MKKNVFIFCAAITSLSLTTFGFINWSNTETIQEVLPKIKTVNLNNDTTNTINKKENLDLVYDVDSRFLATITKENLNKATSVLDIVPKKAKGWWKTSFHTVTISILQEGAEIQETGNNKTLNASQIKLLKTTNYSTNFYIKARGYDTHPETGRMEDYAYYFTIIPEKEAAYISGHSVLINYLKENSKDKTVIIKKDKLKSGKVSFTVTKKGLVSNVKLISTSGYPTIDKVLLELITKIPGKWEPAENHKGKKVDQELVFSFGRRGC
jgi:hypothetical protein